LTDRAVSDRELARAVLREMSQHAGAHGERGENPGHASDVGAVVANAELVLQRLQEHLLGWFGPDGLDALLTRALERTRIVHPILAEVQRPGPGTLRLADMSAAVAAESGPNGKLDDNEVVEGIVALLAAILALIGRLIGDDMMRHLVKQIWPALPDDDVSSINDSANNHERSGK
jgi:hypothetical protein